MPPLGWLPNPYYAGTTVSETLLGYLLATQHNFWSLFWVNPGGPAVGAKPRQPAVNVSVDATTPPITSPPTGTTTSWERERAAGRGGGGHLWCMRGR